MIELLVVISIIAILVGIGTVSFSSARQKGRDGSRKTDLKAVQSALESYYHTYGRYPTSSAGNIKCSGGAAGSDTISWGGVFQCPSGTGPIFVQKLPKDPKQAGIINSLAQLIQNLVRTFGDQQVIQVAHAAPSNCNDEFTGASLDTSKWTFRNDGGGATMSVSGGVLTINAPSGGSSAGSVISNTLCATNNVTIDVRARCSSDGSNCGIYFAGSSGPPSVATFRHDTGASIDNKVDTGTHSPSGDFYANNLYTDIDGGWHIYRISRTPTSIAFYVDGNLIRNETDPNKIRGDAVNLWLHAHGAGGPHTIEVDWVRYPPPPHSLVNWWKFDEGTGTTTADSSGNGNTGTLVNSPTWTTGRIGQALQFNGTNSYVSAPDSPSLSVTGNAITLAAWINPSRTGANEQVVGKWGAGQDSYQFRINSNNGCNSTTNRITFRVESPSNCVLSNTSLTPNQWWFVAGTYDGTSLKIYINGVLDNTAALGTSLTDKTASFSVGRNDDGSYFQGKVDDVGIYNWALTASEILSLYNAAPSPAPTPSPSPSPSPSPTPSPTPTPVPGTYFIYYYESTSPTNYILSASLENLSDPDIFNLGCTPQVGFNYCVINP